MRRKTYLSRDDQILRTIELYQSSQGSLLCYEPVDPVSGDRIPYGGRVDPGWKKLEFPRLWETHLIAVARRRTRFFMAGDLAIIVLVGSNLRGNAVSVTSKRHIVKNFWTSVGENTGLLRVVEIPSHIRKLDLRTEEFRKAIKEVIS